MMGGPRKKKHTKIINHPNDLCMTHHMKKFYLFLIRTDRVSDGDNAKVFWLRSKAVRPLSFLAAISFCRNAQALHAIMWMFYE